MFRIILFHRVALLFCAFVLRNPITLVTLLMLKNQNEKQKNYVKWLNEVIIVTRVLVHAGADVDVAK